MDASDRQSMVNVERGLVHIQFVVGLVFQHQFIQKGVTEEQLGITIQDLVALSQILTPGECYYPDQFTYTVRTKFVPHFSASFYWLKQINPTGFKNSNFQSKIQELANIYGKIHAIEPIKKATNPYLKFV